MSGPNYQVPVEYQRMLAEMSRMRADINALRNRGGNIPVLEEDPAPEEGINFWMLHDGRLRGRLLDGTISEWSKSDHTHPGVSGNPQGGSGSTAPPPPPPYVPTSRRYHQTADWTQSYNKGGTSQRGTSDLYYGHSGDSFNAQQMSMIHFPNLGELAPGPAGTRIAEVWLKLYNKHTWYNNGADLRLGVHNSAGKPGSFQEVRWDPVTIRVGKPSHVEYRLPEWIGEMMRDGTAQGITLHQRTNDRAFYGYAGGLGSGAPAPELRIEYVK